MDYYQQHEADLRSPDPELRALAWYHACGDARAWFRACPSFARAWAACPRPDWLLWVVYEFAPRKLYWRLRKNDHQALRKAMLLKRSSSPAVGEYLHWRLRQRRCDAIRAAVRPKLPDLTSPRGSR